MTRSRDELIAAINHEVRRSQSRTDAYDEAVAEAIGLNRTDQRCLDIIDQENGPTAGRLAEVMGLTTGAITTVLDRLERAGFAQRTRDESDRRRVRVTLTEKAQRELGPYYDPLMRMSEQLYSRYTDEELALLLRFLEDAAELHEGVFAELRARLQAGASSTV